MELTDGFIAHSPFSWHGLWSLDGQRAPSRPSSERRAQMVPHGDHNGCKWGERAAPLLQGQDDQADQRPTAERTGFPWDEIPEQGSMLNYERSFGVS